MKIKKVSKIVTFGVIPFLIAAILVYDVIAIQIGGTEASISSIIITNSYKMPFMVFCAGWGLGVLSGHLFWRMRANKDTETMIPKD